MPRLHYYLLTAASLNNELIPASFRQEAQSYTMPCGVLTKTFACLVQLIKRQKERFRRENLCKIVTFYRP